MCASPDMIWFEQFLIIVAELSAFLAANEEGGHTGGDLSGGLLGWFGGGRTHSRPVTPKLYPQATARRQNEGGWAKGACCDYTTAKRAGCDHTTSARPRQDVDNNRDGRTAPRTHSAPTRGGCSGSTGRSHLAASSGGDSGGERIREHY